MDTPLPSDEVLALLAAGRKIDAIKRHRLETGAGLAEAKQAVESVPEARLAGLAPASLPGRGHGAQRGGRMVAATVIGLIGLCITGAGLLEGGDPWIYRGVAAGSTALFAWGLLAWISQARRGREASAGGRSAEPLG